MVSKEGKAYRVAVRHHIEQVRAKTGAEGRIAVRVQLYAPNRVRRDLDNILKALLDAMATERMKNKVTGKRVVVWRGIYDDDSQIDKLLVERMTISKDNPRVEVRIMEIGR